MDLLEAKNTMLDLLAEKLSLQPGNTLFPDALPPGVQEGVSLTLTGILSRTPHEAAECTMEVAGFFESEETLFSLLEKLCDLLQSGNAGPFLALRQSGMIKLGFLPGDLLDRYTFVFPLQAAFV